MCVNMKIFCKNLIFDKPYHRVKSRITIYTYMYIFQGTYAVLIYRTRYMYKPVVKYLIYRSFDETNMKSYGSDLLLSKLRLEPELV